MLLGELLREMREQDGGYFPDEAWFEIHRTFALPYVEVVILRQTAAGATEVFLSRREEQDPHWPGRPWHIPGGMWRVEKSRDEACTAVALRELDVAIISSTEVMTYKWPNHPYANPISHVCLCVPASAPRETSSSRFFPMSDLPTPMLMHHSEFLMACHRHLAGQS